MVVGGKPHASAALPPGKTQCTLYRRLGGPHGWCGRVRKISPPTGIRSPDRSESLYRLIYAGPRCHVVWCQITNVSEEKPTPIFRVEKYATWRTSELRVAYHCTLKMGVVCSSERLMLLYQTARHQLYGVIFIVNLHENSTFENSTFSLFHFWKWTTRNWSLLRQLRSTNAVREN
jgi:hypothetical protein